jgi:hypothetical protein
MGQVWSSRVVDVMERICRAVAAAAVKTPRAVLVQMLLALAVVAVSWRSIVGSFVTVAPLLIATAKFGPTGPACWPGRPLAGDEEVPRLHLVPARQLVKCAGCGRELPWQASRDDHPHSGRVERETRPRRHDAERRATPHPAPHDGRRAAPGRHDSQRADEPADQRVRAAGVLGGLRAVPAGVAEARTSSRTRADREVDGVGGEAVKELGEAVLILKDPPDPSAGPGNF